MHIHNDFSPTQRARYYPSTRCLELIGNKGIEAELICHPLSESSNPNSKTSEDDRKRTGTITRILLVEDDPGIAKLLRVVLEQNGYEVICLGDADEANSLISKEEFDLIVTDIQLPSTLNGIELSLNAKKLNPNQKIILISGLTSQTEVEKHQELRSSDVAFFAKPFTFTDVVDHINKL